MVDKELNEELKKEIQTALESAQNLVGWILCDEFQIEVDLSEAFVLDVLKNVQKITTQVSKNRPKMPYCPTIEMVPLLYNIALLTEIMKHPITKFNTDYKYSRKYGNPKYSQI